MKWRAIILGAIAGIDLALLANAWWSFGDLKSKWDCWRAPPVVEFHQSMMLCPGQSAVMRIIVIPVGPREDRGI